MTQFRSKNSRQSSQLDIEKVFPHLLRISGINFNAYKLPTLQRAIYKRMHFLKKKKVSDYIDYLKKDPKEAGILSSCMLIKVTQFFRDPKVYAVIEKKILPRLNERVGNGPIRIWVPACCTGEEVYSLALLCAEYFKEKKVSIQIFGTDLSEDVLQKARAGIYSKKDLSSLNKKYLRYFTKIEGQYQIDRSIRGLCTFARQNLIEDPPFSKLDLISCRNVLIYLKPELQEKLIKTLHYALNPDGLLVLGKSENIGGLTQIQLFESLDKNYSIYKKRPVGKAYQVPAFRFIPPKSPTMTEEFKSLASVPFEFDLTREMDRILIERTGQAAVLINEADEVIQTRGNVSSYFSLPSGRMSANVLKLMKDDFAFELKMALEKAQKNGETVRATIEIDAGLLDAEIIPLHKAFVNEKYFLIVLKLRPRPVETNFEGKRGVSSSGQNRKIASLQRELAANKAWVQGVLEDYENTIQELKSVHEEALSSNEELQSLNEELQTAKEELESTNEELTTVNEQLMNQMEALRLSEERFRILVDSVKEYAIFMLDPFGRIVTWNKGAERINGYKAEEIIGQHFSRFYTKEDHAKPTKELQEASRTGIYKEEGWRVRKDGSKLWARVVLTALRDKTGKLTGFAKVTCDMTHKKRDEERLRQSEERFRLMIESAKEYAIFMLDPSGRILTWNVGAQRLKGYQAEEILGKHISIFYAKKDRARKLPQTNLATALKEGQVIDEGWRVRKDGTTFWANVTITALRDEHGELRGFSKVTRDMTERIKIEDALRKSNQLLEERVKERTLELERNAAELIRSNADLQQFASIASHDLQEPLRMISLYADLIKRRLKDVSPEILEYFGFVQDGAIRAQRLIKELLAYSRIGGQSSSETVPVIDVLKHVLSLMDASIKESGAKVTYGRLPVLEADRFQLEQLFQNLISNAIKYKSDAPPEIHISARQGQDEWTFCVRDNGIGIDPEYHQLIFVIFKRLHSSNEYPGTGIGLALCQKIVERQGGRLWVESQVGKGSKFCFTLPDRK